MATSHGLGFGNGGITDNGDGTIEYRATGKLMPAFRINVADVTGFSVRKATKQDKKNGASAFQSIFVLYGGGTELASVAVNANTPKKLEDWIRAHPSFKGNVLQNIATAVSAPESVDVADQLMKLVQLRDAGALSPEEFDQAKAKLLS